MTWAPPLPFRLGGWGTVVADPPWLYEDQANRMRCPYPPMTVDEIARLPIATIVAEVAHLYLWVTNAYVEDAYRIARAWGFRPLDLVPWVKRRRPPKDVDVSALLRRLLRTSASAAARAEVPAELLRDRWLARGPLQIGGGHRIRNAAEFYLVGIRGPVLSFPPALRFEGVIEAPAKGRGLRHSQKPPELYRRARAASPGPYLELFARGPREGWTVWGDEAAG